MAWVVVDGSVVVDDSATVDGSVDGSDLLKQSIRFNPVLSLKGKEDYQANNDRKFNLYLD